MKNPGDIFHPCPRPLHGRGLWAAVQGAQAYAGALALTRRRQRMGACTPWQRRAHALHGRGWAHTLHGRGGRMRLCTSACVCSLHQRDSQPRAAGQPELAPHKCSISSLSVAACCSPHECGMSSPSAVACCSPHECGMSSQSVVACCSPQACTSTSMRAPHPWKGSTMRGQH